MKAEAVSKSLISAVLQALDRGGAADALLIKGVTYSQIALVIGNALKLGLVEVSEKKVLLTAEGFEAIQRGNRARAASQGWPVRPERAHYLVEPGSPVAYLPARRTARKLRS
jgi:hypothetical protein